MTAIVGREAELGAVEAFVAGVTAGPAALVIEGEAGIGKTTIWLEAVRAAERRSYRVLQARPAEAEAKLSYVALGDLVGGAFEETRAALPAPQERALASALLRVDTKGPADPRTTATALVAVLAALAAEQPVLVAVDDVQWVDRASARALEFAVRRLPERLGLVLARRGEGDELPLGLGRALPEDRIVRLVPGPLSLAALHHLISSRLGTSLPRPLLTRLGASSGGNPFFALELARALAGDARDRALDEPLPVPPSLLRLVAKRIGGLSSGAQEAVLVAASLSRPTVPTVGATVGAEVDLQRALVEAEEAGVLVSVRGRLRFTHPLLASVVYGSASEERRRQVHRRLAEVVSDLEERGRHLAQSATEADEATAAEVEAAAREAARRGAQDAAAELFEAARRLTPADRPNELARRFLGEAFAVHAVGDFAGARSRAERALAVVQAPTLRAEALALLGTIAWFHGESRAGVEHVEQALTAAADDPELRSRIAVKLVRFSTPVRPASALEHADEVIARLRPERDPALLAHVLIDRCFVGAQLGHGARRDLLERGLELEAETLPSAAEGPHPMPIIWFQAMDEFDSVEARHALEDAWYRDHGWDVQRADRLAQLAQSELRAGHWALAERHIEESCAVLGQVDARGVLAMPFVWRALVDAHKGRIDRARSTLVRLLAELERTHQVWWSVVALSTAAFVEFAAGDHRAADAALTRMRKLAESLGFQDVLIDRSEPFHLESLAALGELDRAREALRRLEQRGRTLPRLWIAATLPRTRALVRSAEGDLTGALAALEELDLAAAEQLPFELAWTLLVKGRLNRRAKQKRAAADALRQAQEIFDRLGAPAWSLQARGELERVGLRQRPPGELTATELRVAELAASGLTNHEVAKAAFMSSKTVEANLTRVYRKLGIRSRAELGARMADGQRGIGAQT